MHSHCAPVQYAAHERRNERRARVGGGDGLREAEEQRHVAVGALALEDLRRADALPGRRAITRVFCCGCILIKYAFKISIQFWSRRDNSVVPLA
jgi:hypothetical protein